MSGWQKIETAPKDGTWVLLYVPERCQRVWFGSFIDDEYRKHGKVIREDKHWVVQEPMIRNDHTLPHPTHWMPIPEGPAE